MYSDKSCEWINRECDNQTQTIRAVLVGRLFVSNVASRHCVFHVIVSEKFKHSDAIKQCVIWNNFDPQTTETLDERESIKR
jgi:hypothetical protein